MLIFFWNSIPIVMDSSMVAIRTREVKSTSHQSMRDWRTGHAVSFSLIIVQERMASLPRITPVTAATVRRMHAWETDRIQTWDLRSDATLALLRTNNPANCRFSRRAHRDDREIRERTSSSEGQMQWMHQIFVGLATFVRDGGRGTRCRAAGMKDCADSRCFVQTRKDLLTKTNSDCSSWQREPGRAGRTAGESSARASHRAQINQQNVGER
jgi:hypothetical protein